MTFHLSQLKLCIKQFVRFNTVIIYDYDNITANNKACSQYILLKIFSSEITFYFMFDTSFALVLPKQVLASTKKYGTLHEFEFFAPRPRHFNLLIVDFSLGGVAWRKPEMAKISHHTSLRRAMLIFSISLQF